MTKRVEELQAELAALTPGDNAMAQAAPVQPAQATPATKSIDPLDLAHKQILDDLLRDDPKPYLASHKKCRVCLRHNQKDADACQLCGSAGHWEPVTIHRPDCLPLGRKHASTQERLSNLPWSESSAAMHLRWLLTWREGDGTTQINAAKFLPTAFVLSYSQRCWCKRLLEWLEPGTTVPEPEPDAQEEPQAEAVEIDTPQAKPRLKPSDIDKHFAYEAWKIAREAENKPASVKDWIAENGQNV